jgi:hypothetical protein
VSAQNRPGILLSIGGSEHSAESDTCMPNPRDGREIYLPATYVIARKARGPLVTPGGELDLESVSPSPFDRLRSLGLNNDESTPV